MERYSIRHLEVIRSIMLSFPEVREGKMFGYPAFFLGRRMFACIYESGVGIKLPAEEAARLLLEPDVTHFQPHEKRKMREWVLLTRADSAEYLGDIGIFENAMQYLRKINAGKAE